MDNYFDNSDEILADEMSQKNLQSLKNIYTEGAPLIVFFGAGLGKVCGIPLWNDLLEELCKEGEVNYSSLGGEYWDKASSIEQNYRGGSDVMYEDMKKILIPNQTHSALIHNLLLQGNFNSLFTTNLP